MSFTGTWGETVLVKGSSDHCKTADFTPDLRQKAFTKSQRFFCPAGKLYGAAYSKDGVESNSLSFSAKINYLRNSPVHRSVHQGETHPN